MNSELSMDQVLIEKLTKILDVNLDKENFGVKELAKEAGLSRSQLHRKLKSIKGKSASRFIREFRLKKAMVMLQNNVATASEIAYRVGFSSPTYFNTCFHDYYGYPPGEVKFRKSSADEVIINQIVEQEVSDQDDSTIKMVNKLSYRQRLITVFSVVLLLIIAISYYLYFGSQNLTGKELVDFNPVEKSIAIIPFRSLNVNVENRYFADGVTGSIQNLLSNISDLKVVPKTNMEKYLGSLLTTSDIGKEVGVLYLLDGSVQKHGDSIRVIAHLIDARENSQLSSYVFDWEYKNIFEIQRKIAVQIAEDLNIKIAPDELENIEKLPTKNLEAYSLFLQANFQGKKRTKRGFDNAASLFEQTIALDSTFTKAYFGYGCLWMWSGAVWGTSNEQESWQNAKRLLEKTKKLDSTYSKVVNERLLDGYYIYEWDYDRMEKEYKNSSVSIAYLMQTGRYEESLAIVNQSLRKDPTRVFCMYLGH